MIKYEAKIDGGWEEGVPFVEFDEVKALEDVFQKVNINPKKIASGPGGYYKFQVLLQSKLVTLHIYLKKLTFGGRDNRPFEKRAQFSASLDRRGFDIVQSEIEISLIMAVYRREEFPDIVLCAWDIHDWGHNIGRAFNCFIDIKNVAKALQIGISQHKTSIGQIAVCFRSTNFLFYLKNRTVLHKHLLDDSELLNVITKGSTASVQQEPRIPSFDELFQTVLDSMRSFNGVVSVEQMESEIARIWNLPYNLQNKIHNINEGNRTELGYQLAWTRNYLKRAGLIDNPMRGIWVLTELGESKLNVDPIEIRKRTSEAAIREDVEKDFREDIFVDDENVEVEREEVIDAASPQIENPFDPNEVDIRTRTMSLDLILKRLEDDEIDMFELTSLVQFQFHQS